MVDIAQYRCRIGQFCQKLPNKKFLYRCYQYETVSDDEKVGRHVLSCAQVLMKIAVILVLTSHVWSAAPACASASSITHCDYTLLTRDRFTCYHWPLYSRGVVWVGDKTGNFWARYVNGNTRGNTGKGIHNMHFNIRHLKYKVNEVKNIINQHNPNLLGLSECELKKENIVLKDLKIPGYEILFPKSWEVHGYARVVVYVKKSLQYEQVFDLEDNLVQSVWLKGGYKNGKKIYFCHAYREHSSAMGDSIASQSNYLQILLAQWEAASEHSFPIEPNEVHVSLDMNLDYLKEKWLKASYRLCSLTQLVQNACNANNFTQLVLEPTRCMYNSVTDTTEISCIDHVYCNAKHRCSTPVVTVSGASDHDIISYIRYSKAPPCPARTIRKRSYKDFIEEDFVTDMAVVDWTDVYSATDVDSAADIFTRKFTNVLNRHAPWVIFQQRKYFCPWLTETTKELMKQRDLWKKEAKNLAISNPGIVSDEQRDAWKQFKEYRNKVNNMKKHDERNYKKNKMNENVDDPSSMWKTAKTFMNWKSPGTPSQIEVNNSLITSAALIATHMNQFFIDKVRLIRASMGQVVTNLGHCKKIMENKRCGLRLHHVSEQKVLKIIESLSNSRSLAIDELDNFSVKLAAEVIPRPLHHIITLSIMQEKFPSSWKFAKVLPLHKKLSTLEMKNYRPVAILSPLSKVLEKIIYEQLYEYFTANKIFHPNLHGYRKNRSTQTALVQMYDRWVQAAAKGQVSGAVLLDLSAAFDLVSPDILLQKLEIYGLDKSFLTWIDSYMTNRYQGVWIDHTLSSYLPCDIGVPQGSNLGPLFFLLFVNDLPFILNCDMDQYADDSTLTATGKSVPEINDKLEESCSVVSNWMVENKLKLNADKTHILTLGTQERLRIPGNKVTVTMDGFVLEESLDKFETLLGCSIEPNLKWHKQVRDLLGKLKKRLAGLAHLKFILPYNLRKVVCEGLFNSVLGYCLPLFGGCDIGEIKNIQILQNKAAQMVTHSAARANRKRMYDELDWMTVNQLIRYFSLLAVFRIRTTGEPEYLAAALCHDNIYGKLIVQNTKLTLAQKSFKIRGACNWNALPASIRSIQKIGKFKKEVKIWIKQNVPRFLD